MQREGTKGVFIGRRESEGGRASRAGIVNTKMELKTRREEEDEEEKEKEREKGEEEKENMDGDRME